MGVFNMHQSRSLALTILIMGFALLVGLGRLSSVQAAGITYYIATNGSDSNPGTELKPWLTLQKATTTLMPGDTVLVKNGTYNKQGIAINRSGTATAWITYKAYPGNKPKIVSSGWKGLDFNNVAYIEWNGFEIQGVPTSATNYSGDGVWIENTTHHIRIMNNDIYGFGGGGIKRVAPLGARPVSRHAKASPCAPGPTL